MSGFSSFPQFWLLRCSWEQWVNTPPIWVWCWGHFCCYPFLLVFVHLRVGPGILHLYARTTLLHRFAFCARVFAILSRTVSLLDKTRNSRFRFLFEFFIAQKSSMHRIRERGMCMDGISRHLHRMQLFLRGYPRMTFFSEASFSVLRSS